MEVLSLMLRFSYWGI